jgi:hypothetical protein
MSSNQRWRAGAGGLVGAMAMTGVRRLTTELGVVGETPPDALAEHAAPGLLARLPDGTVPAAVELAHWTYGVGGGVLFSALPAFLRRRRLSGPAYGLASWAVFEAVLAPRLGLPRAQQSRLAERLVLAADHALYGAIVATADRGRRDRGR